MHFDPSILDKKMEEFQWYLFSGFGPYIAILLIGIFLFIGWVSGKRRIRNKPDEAVYINSTYENAIFGLVALVIGFTFYNAVNHYDARKDKVRVEVSSIYNSYEGLRYLNASDGAKLHSLLNNFLDLRLNLFNNVKNFDELDKRAKDIDDFGNQIRVLTFQAIERAPAKTKQLAEEFFKPQIILMLDSTHQARLLMLARPHSLIFFALFMFMGITGFIGGFEMATKQKLDWIFTSLYIVVVFTTFHIIFALEFPDTSPAEQARYNKGLIQLKAHISEMY